MDRVSDLHAHIFSAAGGELGVIADIWDWNYTEVLDGAGEWHLECWATLANETLLAEGRRADIYGTLEGVEQGLSSGPISGIEPTMNLGGSTFYVTGQDRISELATRVIPALNILERGWARMVAPDTVVRGRMRWLSLSSDCKYNDRDRPEMCDNDPVNPTLPDLTTWARVHLRQPQWSESCERLLYDYQYVGFDTRFDRVFLDFQTPNTSATGALQGQYYAGDSGWTGLASLVDGTQSGSYTFAQNGEITWTMPGDWERTSPTEAAGDWFWIRLFKTGYTPTGDIYIRDARVYSDVPTTNALNLLMTYAPTTWKQSGYAATDEPAYDVITGMTVLAALDRLREQIGGHFRAELVGGLMEVQWFTSFSASGIIASGLQQPDDTHVRLTKLVPKTDLTEFITRVYPIAENATLADTTRELTAPYELDLGNGFIRNTDAETAYGRRERMMEFEVSSAAPEDSFFYHPVLTANMLCDVALEWLKQRDAVAQFYSVSATSFREMFEPGYTIGLDSEATVQGDKTIDIDTTVNVVSVRSTFDQAGFLAADLEVTTIERRAMTGARVVAEAIGSQRRSGSIKAIVGGGDAQTLGGYPPGAFVRVNEPTIITSNWQFRVSPAQGAGDAALDIGCQPIPHISFKVETDSAYLEELMRLGDLLGNWGYTGDAEQFGLAIGKYAANLPNLTLDIANGLRIRSYETVLLQAKPDGTASIGGWALGPTSLSAGQITLDPVTPSIRLGAASDYLTGIGIWMGLHETIYKVHIGNPAGDHMRWDGNQLYVTGVFVGGSDITYTLADTFTINQDGDDVDVQLILKRTTGGSATLQWNGSTLSLDKVLTLNGLNVGTATGAGTGEAWGLSSAAAVEWKIISDFHGSTAALILQAESAAGNVRTGEIRYHAANREILFIGETVTRMTIESDTGNTSITGGLNVGTGTGAGAGDGFFSGEIRITDVSTFVNERIQVYKTALNGLVITGISGTTHDFVLAEGSGGTVLANPVGTIDIYFAGNVGIGITSPSALIHGIKTTEQLRLGYDAGGYFSVTVSDGGTTKLATATDNVTGNLELEPAGHVILDPVGNGVNPETGYDINLGSMQKKYLTLHCAELWVETLVAHETIATIGGRILVGPTTVLTTDLTDGVEDTTITVKHNEMAVSDTCYLEANGKVEFMVVTAGPTGAGPYEYTVIRDRDGSGRNLWYAGDAVFNTGAAGDGFIDLYSMHGIKAPTEYGPSIVGNVRNSTVYNAWTEHWAIGNLNGIYGYGATAYGVAFGAYGESTYITIDSTNGIQFKDAAHAVRAQLTGTTWTIGRTATEHIQITSTEMKFMFGGATRAKLDMDIWTLGSDSNEHVRIGTTYVRLMDGASCYTELLAGALTLGLVAGGEYVVVSGAAGVQMYGGGLLTGQWKNDGDLILGQVATNKGNMFWDQSAGRVNFRGGTGGTVVGAYIDTTGAITAGAGTVTLDVDGITLPVAATTRPPTNEYESFSFGLGAAKQSEIFTLWNNVTGKSTLTLEVYTTGGAAATGGIDLVAADAAAETDTVVLSVNENGVTISATGAGTADLDVHGGLDVAADLRFTGVGVFAANTPQIYKTAGSGLILTGFAGTTYDFVLAESAGGTVIANPAGTLDTYCAGKVGIGCTPAYRLDILTNAVASHVANFFNDGNHANRYGVRVQSGDDGAVDCDILAAHDGDGTWHGGLRIINANVELVQASDRRHKTNLTAVTVLDRLRQVDVPEFSWIDKAPGARLVGFIAQQLVEHFPEAVRYDEERDRWCVAVTRMIPVNTKAVQELDQEVLAIRAEIAAGNAAVAGLQERLDDMERRG